MTPTSAYGTVRPYVASGIGFDAVFAATDISAMRALAGSGLAIPHDVAVVGFDDIAMAARVHPSLTTVRQDFARGTSLLVDIVLRCAAGGETESAMLPGELVVRESTDSTATSNLRRH